MTIHTHNDGAYMNGAHAAQPLEGFLLYAQLAAPLALDAEPLRFAQSL